MIPPLPPGPTSGSLVQRFRLLTHTTLDYLAQLTRDHGDIAYVKIGGRHYALVNHPDHVQDILVTHKWNFTKRRADEEEWRMILGAGLLNSAGDYHRHERRLMETAFRAERIAEYAVIMVDCARRLAEQWHDGAATDVYRDMLRLTLAIAGRTFLDADMDAAEVDQITKAVDQSYAYHDFLRLPFGRWLARLPLPPVRRFREAIVILDTIARRKIAARRQAGAAGGDPLSLLIRATDADGRLTDARVRDEAMTILLAGHETTANALSWTWYLLARHPEAEARLQAELDSVLGGRLPTAEDVPRLEFTEAVFAEALRLYPPVWWQARSSVSEFILGGYGLPADTMIFWSLYGMQRDARWYTDPARFDPDRMTRARRAERHRFVFFPFGGGTRHCLGESFAWMEGVLTLAVLAQRWRPRLAPGQEVGLEPLITLRPKGGLPMTIERRQQ